MQVLHNTGDVAFAANGNLISNPRTRNHINISSALSIFSMIFNGIRSIPQVVASPTKDLNKSIVLPALILDLAIFYHEYRFSSKSSVYQNLFSVGLKTIFIALSVHKAVLHRFHPEGPRKVDSKAQQERPAEGPSLLVTTLNMLLFAGRFWFMRPKHPKMVYSMELFVDSVSCIASILIWCFAVHTVLTSPTGSTFISSSTLSDMFKCLASWFPNFDKGCFRTLIAGGPLILNCISVVNICMLWSVFEQTGQLSQELIIWNAVIDIWRAVTALLSVASGWPLIPYPNVQSGYPFGKMFFVTWGLLFRIFIMKLSGLSCVLLLSHGVASVFSAFVWFSFKFENAVPNSEPVSSTNFSYCLLLLGLPSCALLFTLAGIGLNTAGQVNPDDATNLAAAANSSIETSLATISSSVETTSTTNIYFWLSLFALLFVVLEVLLFLPFLGTSPLRNPRFTKLSTKLTSICRLRFKIPVLNQAFRHDIRYLRSMLPRDHTLIYNINMAIASACHYSKQPISFGLVIVAQLAAFLSALAVSIHADRVGYYRDFDSPGWPPTSGSSVSPGSSAPQGSTSPAPGSSSALVLSSAARNSSDSSSTLVSRVNGTSSHHDSSVSSGSSAPQGSSSPAPGSSSALVLSSAARNSSDSSSTLVSRVNGTSSHHDSSASSDPSTGLSSGRPTTSSDSSTSLSPSVNRTSNLELHSHLTPRMMKVFAPIVEKRSLPTQESTKGWYTLLKKFTPQRRDLTRQSYQ